MNASKKLSLACLVVSTSAGLAWSQEAPSLPKAWVNSPGFSNADLLGKAAFLVFFEET